MKSIKELEKSAFERLKSEFGYTNPMEMPRLVKVIVSAGVGSFKDKKKIDLAVDRLSKITGQHVVKKGAKKSIASFKVREGDPVGLAVTIRGSRMRGFLDKFLNAALPRTKDFRGLSEKSVDPMGNLTIGVPEHTIFPETTDEELRDIFGMAVTVVTTGKTAKESLAFFRALGFPFKKDKVVKNP
jgi:large subunit ribosomal protein L5